uniref:VWFA domain-containing protein n=1 Tax=Callorhinchus milii TaxID=7868 RepID=A0A4W3JBL2_CALMI
MSYTRETCGCCDCQKTCPPIDLVFVIDSSESIGQTNFSLAKNFVINIASRLGKMAKNSSELSGSRLGVVQYSHEGAIQAIKLDDPSITSVSTFKSKVREMEWIAGGTWTSSALKYTYERLITPGRRPAAQVTVVVITDGRYDPKDQNSLDALCRGADVYAFGIGDMFESNAEKEPLEKIACNVQDRVRNLSIYADLMAEEFLEEMEQNLCSDPELVCPDLKCASAVTIAPFSDRPTDIVFFVDGSERPGGENFMNSLHFINRVSHELKLAKKDNDSYGARIAILQYGGETQQTLLVDFSYNIRQIEDALLQASYLESTSHLGSAILYAVESLVNNRQGRFRGARMNAEVSFVFLTDGVTSDKNFPEAIEAMRKNNIVTCGIALGSDVDHERLLQAVYKEPTSLFMLTKYSDLFGDRFVKSIVQWLY